MNILKKLHLDQPLTGAYLGTTWKSQPHTNMLDSINPSDESVIASIHTCEKEDVQNIIEGAHQAFLRWRMIPAPQRGALIREIAEELRKHKDFLGSLISLEMGKSKQEGDGEVQEMIDMADFAMGQSRMLYGHTMHSERPFHRLYEQWHPLGVVGIITAFNFPMAVWAWNAFLAIICGNSVIWKPSHKTPLCALALHFICQDILKKHDYPDTFSLIIPTHHEAITPIINDTRVSLISFTGSTKVGKQIAHQVSKRLGKTILELGGNNALIVDESARLELAIPAILFGAVGTAGQRCTSTRRVFIHQHMWQHVITQLLKFYPQIQIGNPLDPKNLMGPLIDKAAVTLYQQTIKTIQSDGGKILYGGETLPGGGYYVKPTLVSNLPSHHALLQQENFIPIVYLLPFKTLDEAIHLQNAVPQGLSSALFTENHQHAEYFLSAMGSDCGIANINVGTSGAEITGAFGGEKETGGGREAGSDAWKSYMRRQTNTINWGKELPLAQGIHFDISPTKKKIL
ncbi:MAG: aldehyde dehydrogenase family protein [Gammaproteobacteria bacterium]|nr:aldehyde dehydrogenase family protein [Gammaproteobacteria bacterium]